MIELFEKGSEITPLNTEAINEWGKAIQALQNITVSPEGIAQVHISDANIVIEIKGEAFNEITENGVVSSFFVAKRTGAV